MLEKTRTAKAYREVAQLASAYAQEHPSEQNMRLAEMLRWLATTSDAERTNWLDEIGRKVGVSNLEAQFANACNRTLAAMGVSVPDEGLEPHFDAQHGKRRRVL